MASHLTIIRRTGKDKHGRYMALTRCVCGVEKELLETRVNTGKVLSCGCMRTKLISQYWGSSREQSFWSKVDRLGPDDCWRWTGCAKAGPKNPEPYGLAGWENKQVRAHRLAYQLTNGEIPGGMMVLHKCDNSLCCNPNHLYLGNHEQNMRDMVERNRRKGSASGEQNGRSKLTQEQADEIRALYASGGMSQQAIADKYGVSQFAVSAIVRNKRYVK